MAAVQAYRSVVCRRRELTVHTVVHGPSVNIQSFRGIVRPRFTDSATPRSIYNVVLVVGARSTWAPASTPAWATAATASGTLVSALVWWRSHKGEINRDGLIK